MYIYFACTILIVQECVETQMSPILQHWMIRKKHGHVPRMRVKEVLSHQQSVCGLKNLRLPVQVSPILCRENIFCG